MRLRVKSQNGSHLLNDLTESHTYNDLLMKLCELTGYTIQSLKLKIGYPPKLVQGKTSDTLNTCGIKNGEQIIVEGTLASVNSLSSVPSSLPSLDKIENFPKIVEKSNGLDAVQLPSGFLVVREMKDDNSCLFRSISYLFMKDPELHRSFREVVAAAINNDPFTYNDAILGQSPDSYAEWILTPKAWGGAIELSILSKHLEIEIVSIDVQTLRMDKFSEDQYPTRMFLLYSGIHYDAISWTPSLHIDMSSDKTIFNCISNTSVEENSPDMVLKGAKMLASIWKDKRKFTDLANFTLKCAVCLKGLVGESEATEHAKVTGHISFQEYS